ncbi:hypothetical protein ACEPPN_000002 [Leptodophora sp. 'Broadleaf-Isolate-01']
MPVYSDNWKQNMGARILSHDAVDYDFIKSWIFRCNYGHGNKCQKRPVPVRPLVEIDVIHCSTRKLVPVQLFSPSGHPSLEFVTLSYLWGPPQAAGQTSVVDGKIPDEVPRVIEDAITVVTKLGLEYLWIDRYCIPQNDPVVRKAQIQQMGEIYARSALTIIAAAGTGPDHGLPGVSVPRIPQLSAQIGKYTIADLGFLATDMWHSKWDTRAWTYQEGLLSPRRLVFTDHAAYFQCREMYCYENLTLPIYDLKASHLMVFDSDRVFNRIFPVAKSPPGELMKRITTLFKREISYDTDVLDTLVGIFAEFRDRPRMSNELVRRGSIISPACGSPEVPLDRVDTLYGLPLYHKRAFQKQHNSHLSPTAILILALCWGISGAVLRRNVFPSWSWAGWKADQSSKDGASLSFGRLDTLINRQTWTGGDHPPPAAFPVSIEVLATDGSWTNWEKCWEDIVATPEISEKTTALRIRGWTCNLKLERKESKWKLHSPEKLDSQDNILDHIDEQDLGLPSQDGCTLSLKALAVYIDYPHALTFRDDSNKGQNVRMLLLREIQSGDFERVGLLSHTFPGNELSYNTRQNRFKAEGIDFQLEKLVIV